MSGHRVQVTVFLEPQVHQAAKQRAKDMKLSLSATVAEAAKESLLSSYRSEREKEILKAAERNFYAVRRLEQRMRIELQVLKELIGLGMRSFFNHTPPIPDTGKAAALLSGKQRFQRYLDLVASNLRGGGIGPGRRSVARTDRSTCRCGNVGKRPGEARRIKSQSETVTPSRETKWRGAAVQRRNRHRISVPAATPAEITNVRVIRVQQTERQSWQLTQIPFIIGIKKACITHWVR